MGYNENGDGYISIENSNNSQGFIKKMGFTHDIFYVKNTSASETTYYTDYAYSTSTICYAIFGGSNSNGKRCGIFATCLNYNYNFSTSNFGAALSCKPIN